MGCGVRSVAIEDGLGSVVRVADELNITGDLSRGLWSECDVKSGTLAGRNGKGEHNARDRESRPSPVGRTHGNTGIAGGQSCGQALLSAHGYFAKVQRGRRYSKIARCYRLAWGAGAAGAARAAAARVPACGAGIPVCAAGVPASATQQNSYGEDDLA